MNKKLLLAVVTAMAFGIPAWAQDAPPGGDNPPAEPTDPPPDEDIPDDGTPMSEEKIRQRLVEKEARAKVQEFKRRMEAAKNDTERAAAISDTLGQNKCPAHPMVVSAVSPYLNPRPIHKGLQYGDGVIAAALAIIKSLPFDESHYAIQKSLNDNRTNVAHVSKMIAAWGELKNPKAISELVKFMQDKRDGKLALCAAAATAIGSIGHRDGISALIVELEEEDRAGANEVKAKERRAGLNKPVVSALTAITKETFVTGADWRAWWNKNIDTFQKPVKIPVVPDEEDETPK